MHEFQISKIIRQPNQNVTIEFKDLTGDYPRYKAGQFLTLYSSYSKMSRNELRIGRSSSIISIVAINLYLDY